MQSQQQMATMAGMNANVGGPVEGTPIMGNLPRPGPGQRQEPDQRIMLNTYIYDYFLRNNHHRLARMMIDCDLNMTMKTPAAKPSPSGRNVNGVDAMDLESREGLPDPRLPEGQVADNSFLLDWWCQFWDIFNSARKKQPTEKGAQYINHTRHLTQLHNEQRNQRMMMNHNGMGAAQYPNMMRGMPNGVAPNDLKSAAAMNNRNPSNGNPMANMNQIKSQAMLSAQMQRNGSGMNMNGQRPQSPGSSENAPSPNKRARVEGNHLNSPQMGAARSQGIPQPPMRANSAGQANQMLLAGGMNAGNMPSGQFNEFAPQAQNVQQKSIEVYAQSMAHQQRIALNNHAMAQGMNSGVQGPPMNQQGLDGQHDMFSGNGPRPGMPAGPPPGQQGNHALQDYQMQLMLLEQQNKKRLLMARQEQDSMSGPHAQPAVGATGYPPSMSPPGSRAGPSPNPADQMKRGTPKMNQPGLPGSPMPDATMPQQRSSPAPNMNFDPSQLPHVMPPQFAYPQMPQNPMMRPPSSHPGNFNAQQVTPQQMEAMRQNGAMQNGAWRGQPPPGMMQSPGQQLGPMGNNPQQRSQMPPPPAPAGEQPRAQEPSPSQPAQAPPTPSQSNKANPKKKPTKDNKKPAKAKGANAGATQAASNGEEPPTPTPSTPITPMHPKSFGQNGQQQPAQPPSQPQPVPQQQPPMDNNNAAPPFGNISDDPNFDLGLSFADGPDALNDFDFDSFLHVGGDDPAGFGSLGGDFGFDTVEAGGDL